MGTSTSLEKGDSFELRVFNKLSQMLKDEELYVSGKQSEIFWKKPLESRFRNRPIIFDLVIETRIVDLETPSLRIVIECKNHGTSIPVGKLEEFHGKLAGLQDHNVKGWFLSASPFQKEAVAFAKSVGILLGRFDDSDGLQWLIPNKDWQQDSSTDPGLIEKFSSQSCLKFIALSDYRCYFSFASLLISLGVIDTYSLSAKYLEVPFLSPELLETIVEEFPSDEIYSHGRLDDMRLVRFVGEKFGVEFQFHKELGFLHNNKVLGRLQFDPLVISISSELDDDPCQRRFTIAYEVGHLVLHSQTVGRFLQEMPDFEKSFYGNEDLPIELNANMETQANMFAYRLLMPRAEILDDVRRYFVKHNIRGQYIYLDHQPVNIREAHRLVLELQSKYLAPSNAIRNRLYKLGLMKRVSDFEKLIP